MTTILFLLGWAMIFGAFVWATQAHFAQGTKTIATFLIYLFSVATFVCGSVAVVVQPLALWQMSLGALISLLGAALFYWAIHVTRAHNFHLAYAREKPQTLVTRGPYAIVRHPFYLAYLMFWVGMYVTAPWWPTLACLLALLWLYVVAARTEETRFAETEFAQAHQKYKQSVGFLTPNLRKIVQPSFLSTTLRPQ